MGGGYFNLTKLAYPSSSWVVKDDVNQFYILFLILQNKLTKTKNNKK